MPERVHRASGRRVEVECLTCGALTESDVPCSECPDCGTAELHWRIRAANGDSRAVAHEALLVALRTEAELEGLSEHCPELIRLLPPEPPTAAIRELRSVIRTSVALETHARRWLVMAVTFCVPIILLAVTGYLLHGMANVLRDDARWRATAAAHANEGAP